MRQNNTGSKSSTDILSGYIAISEDSDPPEYPSSPPRTASETRQVVPSISFDQVTIDPNTVKLIPIEKARQYKVLPLGKSGDRLQLAMVNPEDLRVVEDVALITGMKVDPVKIEERELEKVLHWYSLLTFDTSLEQDIRILQRNIKNAAPIAPADYRAPDPAGESVVKLVQSLLSQAVMTGASDIHIEPQDTRLRIRMRIDGELSEIAHLPLQVAPAIGSRIKILSNLDISEKRLPQDGRLTTAIDNRQISFRVSTIPSIHGEKLVLRVLDQSRSLLSVESLGLYGSNRRNFDRIIQHPHGLILATGPTGSGKTSTL
ncbi:MAG: GspE/PulE family protein, partial [Bacillota bacterium]